MCCPVCRARGINKIRYVSVDNGLVRDSTRNDFSRPSCRFYSPNESSDSKSFRSDTRSPHTGKDNICTRFSRGSLVPFVGAVVSNTEKLPTECR